MTTVTRNIWAAQLDTEFALSDQDRQVADWGGLHHMNGCGTKDLSFLTELESLIAERKQELPEGSYTTTLFQKGIGAIAKKVGEEGVELALAAVTESGERLTDECADLLFHVLVLLKARNIELASVVSVLKERNQ